MTELTDASPMPIGMHKGKPMIEVPAKHLLYLFEKGWTANYLGLTKYINANMAGLRKEAGYKK